MVEETDAPISPREFSVSEFQKRLVPRLMLDAINCIEHAYEHIEPDRRIRVRHALMLLREADCTDIETAISMLRDIARHLRAIERTVRDNHRPFSAQKVRRVRERVEHIALD